MWLSQKYETAILVLAGAEIEVTTGIEGRGFENSPTWLSLSRSIILYRKNSLNKFGSISVIPDSD